MEKIDSDLRDLNLRCFDTDFEYALQDLAAFERKHSDQIFSSRVEENIISLRGEAFVSAGRFEEAIAEFQKLYETNQWNSFQAQRIAAALLKLGRVEEASAIVKHEILVEKASNYILYLLFWYISNLEFDNAELDQYRHLVDKVIEELEITLPDNELPLHDLIIYLKEEYSQASRRYGEYGLSVSKRDLSDQQMKDELKLHIKSERVGHFRKMFENRLQEIEIIAHD